MILKPGFDFVFIARVTSKDKSYWEVEKAMKNLFKKAGLVNNEKILILLIKFYRKFISPLKKPCCIFYPTCSQYALEAIEKYGVFKGGFMSYKKNFKMSSFS